MTETARHDAAPGTVLVIDDDETNRYILTSWLTRAGHTVLGAADGTAGLHLLAETGDALPEVAVIDVQLPDMSGFEVCERIKADPRTAYLPVVHVSAVAVNTEDHTEGLSRGADAYLDQPIDPNEFLATVTAALRYARARRRAEHLTLRLAALNRATLDVYRAVGFHSFSAAATGGAASLMSAPATSVFLSPQGLTVTLCLVLVEPNGSRIHIANAGHIPPLLIAPGGSAAYLPEHGPLLGLRLPHPSAHVRPTAPGSRLLLITDGLVEVRNQDLDHSLAAFLDAAATGPQQLEPLCDHLLDAFGEDKEDDIALLALHLHDDQHPA
ncbi:fused response regulator/phosphatase [Streptomyces sp. MBT55]|uniref:fused response regulator/phosphatase n=1 Tax=Streptomyces sp. MBT55 TaxID=1488386 RepID=UPI0019127583|nr:fused response regulator/phosphatase [Streptomyces sp. MBT55]MBK6044941.1 fused response regulator/phosphatase [Streptomyces sp. MBT55]